MKIVDELKLTNGVIITDEAPPSGDKSGATHMVASCVLAQYPFIVSAKSMKISL